MLTFVSWLQNHLMPCPFKYLTGVDCPGCGFQRAIIALLQGQIGRSVSLYPPAVPLLLFGGYVLVAGFGKPHLSTTSSKRYLFTAVAAIVLFSYCFKLMGYTATI